MFGEQLNQFLYLGANFKCNNRNPTLQVRLSLRGVSDVWLRAKELMVSLKPLFPGT